MGALFNRSTPDYLTNASPPTLTPPFTVMMWAMQPTLVASNMALWSYSDFSKTIAAGNWFRVRATSTTGVIGASTSTAGADVNAATALGPVAGEWFFIVARFISSTNRKTAALYRTGASHGTSTTSSAPAITTPRMTFGTTQCSDGVTGSWTGHIGEFSLVNADVQPGGAQLDDNLLRQLAYGGPYSVPSIADKILIYRGFRSAVTSDQDRLDEHDVGGGLGRQTWAPTGAPRLSEHPSLPYSYELPIDNCRKVIV